MCQQTSLSQHCCSLLQSVAICCSLLQSVAAARVNENTTQDKQECDSVLQCHGAVLQSVAAARVEKIKRRAIKIPKIAKCAFPSWASGYDSLQNI